jgi:hypothetical protein
MSTAELPPSEVARIQADPIEIPHVHPPIAEALALRPTFCLHLAEPPDAVALALRQQLATTPLDVRWAQVPGSGGAGSKSAAARPHCHAVVAVPKAEQRIWSPWLYLDVHAPEAESPAADAATEVLGRFAPHPSVWTGFAFAYLVLTVGVMAGLVGAVAQLSLGHAPYAAWLVPGCLTLAAVLFVSARAGQQLAQEQMQTLRRQVDVALRQPGA